MSWNQSICFSKNKLAWSGCGLVWQVGCGRIWSVWICKVLVGLVWVWQVRHGPLGWVRFRSAGAGFGRSGALRQVELCRGPVDSVGVWQVRYGAAGYIMFRWVRARYVRVWQVWWVGFRWVVAG